MNLPRCISIILPLIALPELAAADAWRPAEGPLRTRWTRDVSPERAHPEYPRPQLVRKDWLSLNGLWSYGITPREAPRPEKLDATILVPFPIESALSGVMKGVDETQRLWYSRSFTVPGAWKGRRLLLHFGAVDFEAEVSVNGKRAGLHRGGYDQFDVAPEARTALKVGKNTLAVHCRQTGGGQYIDVGLIAVTGP